MHIDRCQHCERPWLHYAVEYEGFTGSGRWARGLISEAEVEDIRPQDAPSHFERLPAYVYGGSYFGGVARIGSGGRLKWDL